MAKPINNIVSNHVKHLMVSANEIAEKRFNNSIVFKLKELKLYDQLKLVIDEINKIEVAIELNDYSFYIENWTSEEILVNQFASRKYLLNVDESFEFKEAIVLGYIENKLLELKSALVNDIPEYTFKDFISGKIDPFFSNFKNEYNISREDYYKIREWQVEALRGIVSTQSQKLIERLQHKCRSMPDPAAFLKHEREKIDVKLENTKPKATRIRAALKDLYIFKQCPIVEVNDEILEEGFASYKSKKIDWKYINPLYLNPIIESLSHGDESSAFNEVTIFYTLNKLVEWFEAMESGKDILEVSMPINWNQYFDDVMYEATLQVAQLRKEIRNDIEKMNASKEEIHEYLFESLEKYRKKFNKLDEKYLFILMRDEDIDKLKMSFIANSFFSNDLKYYKDKLIESIIIHEISWEIVGAYIRIFDNHKLNSKDKSANYIEIISLLNKMVLDKKLYTGLKKVMNDFMQHFHSFHLPVEIYFENTRELLVDLFDQGINRLQGILDNAEPTNKILYIQSRLKQLRLKEFELKNILCKKHFIGKELKFSKRFKQFLKMESDFIEATKDIDTDENLILSKHEMKSDILKKHLYEYGFFEIEKVKVLNKEASEKLIHLLSSNRLPYCIAMLNYLGFLKYLKQEHFKSLLKMSIEIAKWFKVDKSGRSVRANIGTLGDYTDEDISRYTAHKYKDIVVDDYNNLK